MKLTPEQQKQRDELLADMDKMRQRIELRKLPGGIIVMRRKQSIDEETK